AFSHPESSATVSATRGNHRIGLAGYRHFAPDRSRHIIAREHKGAVTARIRVETIFGYRAIGDVPLAVDRENFRLRQIFDDRAQAKHHHLVRHDHHAASPIMERDGVEERTKPQYDVAP